MIVRMADTDTFKFITLAESSWNADSFASVHLKQYNDETPATYVVHWSGDFAGDFAEFSVNADNERRQWFVGTRNSCYRGRAVSENRCAFLMPMSSARVVGVPAAQAMRAAAEAYLRLWLAHFLGVELPTEVTIRGYGFEPNVEPAAA